jgi:hypothetical protein
MPAYHFDNQIRRYLVQFARFFSDWYVTKGTDSEGNPILARIPIKYGQMSRQAGAAMNNNSANSMMSVPQFSFSVTSVEYDQSRTQEPTFVDKMQVRQRKYNSVTKTFESVQGQAFTVERLMPSPYILRLQLDYAFSNQQQQFEIIEQIGPLFNPCVEIQSTDNYIDWTSLSALYQDGVEWGSRASPSTTNEPITGSWKFYIPIWLSAPAKLKKYGVVERIVASIFRGSDLSDMTDDDMLMGTRQKITPYGYKLLLMGNGLQILPEHQSSMNIPIDEDTPPNTSVLWTAVLNQYGAVRPGISQIWLENPHMNTPIVGTITFNPVDDRTLIFNIDSDTLPDSTMAPVDSVINPRKKGPGSGLPESEINQRYLILEDIRPGTEAWGNLTANSNDIIQYDGTQWVVDFASREISSTQYVENLTTRIQYRYNDKAWMKSVDGFYQSGEWSIVI